jgi:hypothetical protein
LRLVFAAGYGFIMFLVFAVLESAIHVAPEPAGL